MITKKTGKILAFLLTLALILAVLPGMVFAEDGEEAPDISQPGVCGHVHDEECGYAEGAPCGHVCDGACEGEEGCALEDDEACGAEEPATEEIEYSLAADIVIMATTWVWNNSSPPTVSDGDTVDLSGSPSGTLDVPAGDTIYLTGSATSAITLNIGDGATVDSTASIQGSTTGTNAAPILTLAGGGGTFDATGGTISNNGTGTAISVTGAGATYPGNPTTVSLENTTVSSGGTGGYAIQVLAINVTVNVESGGIVTSGSSNSNAALTVADNTTGTKINVATGGQIISNSGGYAISDGTSFTTGTSNNTIISISGTVTSGTACAIRSSGIYSEVTVNAPGVVSNAAGNNANPAIYMSASFGGDMGPPVVPADVNVTINGGTVESTSGGGYAIQTAGSIDVTGGTVSAGGASGGSGRAINLIGLYSEATISGGTVQTTGSGAAISTATTNPGTVANASVVVSGDGTVKALGTGTAINITGASSSVTVDGGTVSSNSGNAIDTAGALAGAAPVITILSGTVSAVSGNAINTITNATNAEISIGQVPILGPDPDPKVSSQTGRAINTLGSGSSVEVNGNAQVFVMTQGYAIRSSGTLTLNGGFIFAFIPLSINAGTPYLDARSVVSPAPILPGINGADSNALVVGWNQAAGNTIYPNTYSPSTNNLDLANAFTGSASNLGWAQNPSDIRPDGIMYSITTPANGTNSGFFPITGVLVNQNAGLIFNAEAGLLYLNVSGPDNMNTLAPGGGIGNVGANWWTLSGETNTLYLNNFSWATFYYVPVALTVIKGSATIVLSGTNTFISYNNPASGATPSLGISTNDPASSLTLTGKGTLVAQGNTSAFGADTVIAPASTGGISTFTVEPTIDIPEPYIWWVNNIPLAPNPLGPGTAHFAGSPGVSAFGTPYVWSQDYKYTRITAGPFAAVGDKVVEGTVGTALAGVQEATITLYGDTVINPISGNVSSWFKNLPTGVIVTASAAAGSSTITLTFSGVPLATSSAIFDITIPGGFLDSGMNTTVRVNNNAKFDIDAAGKDDDGDGDEGNDNDNDADGRRSGGSPDTSDKSSIEGWTVSLILSAIGLLFVVMWIKRRKQPIHY